MTKTTTTISALLLSCVAILPASAGDSSKGGMVLPTPVEPCSDREIQPLFSRYAQTATHWTLRAGYRSFKDVELQEIDEFDGSTYDIELLVPLSDSLQLRFYYPLKTEGDARDIATGGDVDVDGDTGLLDFPSLTLEWQFKKANGVGDYNLAAYLGVGYLRDYLDSETQPNGQTDRINHRGGALLFGIKADKQLNNCWTFVGNVGGRYYWESDDIHPNSDSDRFFLLDASAAFIYAPSNAWIYPAVEVVYQGDVSDYNSLQVVPQVIVPIGSNVDLNAGVSVGVLDDGPSTEGRLQLNVRF
ncbi:hypothetical protein NT6N_35010 [Oceaniferula spumae]|uniref:Transporter n=1 Tax=Oceaniferula spumae TaxID=2979115 RepID=A0AAT9FRF2_9BACT